MTNAAAKTMPVQGAKILARSFFKELQESGFDRGEILAVSTELLDLLAEDIRGQQAQRADGNVVSLHAR